MQKVLINQKMILEAEKIAIQRQKKWGKGTRLLSSNRDVIGDLAHQAIEQILDGHFISYESTRTEEYEHGDLYDIRLTINGQIIDLDVKGTDSRFDWEHRGENNIYIAMGQLDKLKDIDYLVFNNLWYRMGRGACYVLGAIKPQDFINEAKRTVIKGYELLVAQNKILKDFNLLLSEFDE